MKAEPRAGWKVAVTLRRDEPRRFNVLAGSHVAQIWDLRVVVCDHRALYLQSTNV